ARQELGWTPTTTLAEMIDEMVGHDFLESQKERLLIDSGFEVSGSHE
ncbi:MAG: GDP-mannose 4,6-dehydratase, partial [Betaproteobacteria bacterium]|nr:GDP-mannose 4,6-dehydratase [Betaproteobacteria bacterium]